MHQSLINNSEVKYKSAVSILFLFWLLTLPFGAKLVQIDLGPLAIYPNFIFGVILCCFGFFTFRKWPKLVWIILGFLLLWLIQGVIQLKTVGLNTFSLFDIRSLLFQLLFALVIFISYFHLGKEKFQEILVIGLRFFVVFMLLFGSFEVLTGIHLSGATTAKLEQLHITQTHYAPMFVFDNANDYLAVLISLAFLLLIFDREFKNSKFAVLTLFIVVFYFSDLADSKFAKIISLLAITFIVISFLFKSIKHKQKEWVGYVMLSLVLGVGLLLMNSIFLGPKYRDSKAYRVNELHSYTRTNGGWKDEDLSKNLSKSEQLSLSIFLDSLENNNPESSKNTRPNLIRNGLEFIKEKPILGIGPGNFIQRHLQKKTKYDVGSLTSAHCFPIEIISEFGLIAWGYFLILGIIFFLIVKYAVKYKKWNAWLIVFAISLPLIWNMPSAFLYFDIHRLLLPLLVIYLLNLKSNQVNV